MQGRRNDKGMTLLELVISMAISIIVVLMIVSFINNSFRVFRKTNDQVNLQMESQIAINQLVNLAMESKGISDGAVIQNNVDIRYQIDSLDLTGYHDYAIIWRKDYKKLYLVELIPPLNNMAEINFDSEDHFDQEYMLAEYVDDFSITSVDGNAALKKIVLQMALGDEEAGISKEVILRNAD